MTTGDSVIIDPRMRYTQMPASDAGTLIDPLCKRRTTPISTGCYFLSGNQLLLLIGCRFVTLYYCVVGSLALQL